MSRKQLNVHYVHDGESGGAVPRASSAQDRSSYVIGDVHAVGTDAFLARPAAPDIGLRVLTFDVRLHRAEDAPVVHEWLDRRRVIMVGTTQQELRVYLPDDSPLLQDIPALKEVASFEQLVMPAALHQRTRRVPAVNGANPRL